MRYVALATDYDGTLAQGGEVAEATVRAVERLKQSGRKLLLVTGRETDDLLHVFRRLDLFDRVVAENGAVIYRPEDRSERLLAERPPEKLLAALRDRSVWPLGVGRVVIGSWESQMPKILEAMREAAVDLDIIYNKTSIMLLPRGVDKASGLRVALEELRLSPRDIVAVGDGENDVAMLQAAGFAAAVADALEAVKESADLVLKGDAGAGVIELIDRMLADEARLHPMRTAGQTSIQQPPAPLTSPSSSF